jgi:pimeloyl-ACP methyl ester carboxylesterase
MKLIYLHGHGASSDSFNFIRSEINGHDEICLEYDSKNGFAANLAAMVEQLKDASDIFFIAHSLGGLYALHLADKLGDRVIGAVTMATPYGGSASAIALNFISPQQIYKDIHPVAGPIMQGRNIDLHAPHHWTAIVTTKGHSQLMPAANDGIVTIDSMRNRRGVKFIEVEANHHEVTQSRHSVGIIKAALRDAKKIKSRSMNALKFSGYSAADAVLRMAGRSNA